MLKGARGKQGQTECRPNCNDLITTARKRLTRLKGAVIVEECRQHKDREGKNMDKSEFGKRARLTPTRQGWTEQVFFVCYNCPAELYENELSEHNCK